MNFSASARACLGVCSKISGTPLAGLSIKVAPAIKRIPNSFAALNKPRWPEKLRTGDHRRGCAARKQMFDKTLCGVFRKNRVCKSGFRREYRLDQPIQQLPAVRGGGVVLGKMDMPVDQAGDQPGISVIFNQCLRRFGKDLQLSP